MLMIARSREGPAIQQVREMKQPELTQALRDALSDRTKIIYQDGHGVFVEYTAPDGQLRMWYPRNRAVVTGSWGVQRMNKKLVSACFRYRGAVNPVTNVYEPKECVRAEQTLSSANVIKEWRGDVFGLMRGIPYTKSAMGMPTP